MYRFSEIGNVSLDFILAQGNLDNLGIIQANKVTYLHIYHHI